MENQVKSLIYGVTVGDCLGVPVKKRKRRGSYHLEDIVEFSVYPLGMWSDDTSLTLCLAESIAEQKGIHTLMEKFKKYKYSGYLTPLGFPFGLGNTTAKAIDDFVLGKAAEKCGSKKEISNGSGALMRLSPLVFILKEDFSFQERFEIIKIYTEITHAHPRATVASVIYMEILLDILKYGKTENRVNLLSRVNQSFQENIPVESVYYEEWKNHFTRLFDTDFSHLSEEDIRTTGYVVDVLEASLWCFLTTSSYREAVLKAVNLGGTTDTIGAITGSFAALYYGLESIPVTWIEKIYKRNKIDNVIEKLVLMLEENLEENIEKNSGE